MTTENIAIERSELMREFVKEMRDQNLPQPGFWMIRLVKGGPLVAAAIFIERDPEFTDLPLDPWPNSETRPTALWAEILGEVVDTERVWLAKPLMTITEAEYRFRTADAAWAREHASNEPMANPRRRIDLLNAPLPF